LKVKTKITHCSNDYCRDQASYEYDFSRRGNFILASTFQKMLRKMSFSQIWEGFLADWLQVASDLCGFVKQLEAFILLLKGPDPTAPVDFRFPWDRSC